MHNGAVFRGNSRAVIAVSCPNPRCWGCCYPRGTRRTEAENAIAKSQVDSESCACRKHDSARCSQSASEATCLFQRRSPNSLARLSLPDNEFLAKASSHARERTGRSPSSRGKNSVSGDHRLVEQEAFRAILLDELIDACRYLVWTRANGASRTADRL
jgi:hypothetical protein